MKRTPLIVNRPRMDEAVVRPRGDSLAAAFDRLATARGLSLREDLARLADGSAQCWASPRRDQLLADGLIERVIGGDGLWKGDQITAAGRVLLEGQS